MQFILKILSLIGLALNLIPSFLVFKGLISADQCKNLMFIGTLLWFITAPMWMNKKSETADA